jgi:circadian clock protein KaiB
MPKRGKVIEGQAAPGGAAQEKFELRLYISGATHHSQLAVRNITALAETYLVDRYELVITDIYQEPEKVHDDQVVVVPMLVKRRPLPRRCIVGDLSDVHHVLCGLELDLPHEKKEPPA